MINLEDMLTERSQTKKATYCMNYLYEMHRKGKSINTERLLVA